MRKKANKALQESEERFLSIFNNMDVGITLLDLNGHIIRTNELYCDFLGYSQEEIVGMHFSKFTHPEDLNKDMDLFDALVKGKRSGYDFEKRHVRKNGKIVWGRLRASLVRDDNGHPKYALMTCIDITERKRAEETLRESEEKFRLTFENAKDAILWADSETGIIINCNKAAETLLEKKREEIIGRSQTTLHPPQKAEYYSKMFKRHIEQRGAVDDEAEIITKSGKIKTVHITASTTSVAGKSIIQGIFRDITEQKRMEAALRESEGRYRNLVETAPVVIFALSKDGTITSLNPAFEKITGWSRNEWLGKSFTPIIHPDDLPLAMESFQKTLRGETPPPHELRVLSKSGEYLIGEFTSAPQIENGKVVGEFGVVRDITEHKRAEEALRKSGEALRESEKRYRTLIENIGEGIGVVDEEERFIFVNPAAENLFGVPTGGLVGRNLKAFVTPEQFSMIKKQTGKRHKGARTTYEIEIIRPDKERRFILVTAVPQTDDKERFVSTFGVFRDITERKKAEETLRESEERYRELTESITDVFFAMDRDLRYTYWNKASEKLTGISAKDAIGKSLTEVFPDVKGTKVEQFYLETLRTQQPQSFVNEYQLRGEDFVFEINAYPTKDGLSVFVKDVTERKKAEEALRESEGRYRNLVETVPVVLYALSEDGTITSLNPAFEKLTGWSRDEWLGKSFPPIIHPDDLPLAIESFQKTLSGEIQPPIELRVLSKSGEYLIGEFTSTPKIENGKVVGELGIVRDITERKRAEEALRESQEKFERLFMDNPEAAVYMDSSFHILDINPRFANLFGYSLEEVRGKLINDVIVPKGKVKEGEELDKKALEGYVHYDTVRKRKDRSLVPVSISAAPIIVEGKSIGTVGLYRDITERKMLEERLSTLNLYGGKLNAARDLQEVYELTLDAMEETLGFEHAAFMVVEKGNLRDACLRGYPTTLSVMLPLDGTKKGITVKAANMRKPVLVPDVEKDKDYVGSVPSIRSELAVPVVAEDKVFGVLDVESRKLGAFDEKDVTLLQILASHAATAISNLKKRGMLEKRSNQFASLMKSSAEMIHSTDMRQRLQKIAEAIRELGWRRVVISVRDENMAIRNPEDMVTAGLTREEKEFLWNNRRSGQKMLERYGPEYERFKMGEFYYLPWSDPWVREKFSEGVVLSHLKPEEMVDWYPDDLLYAPLRLADGRIVGTLSVDDPTDGRRPSKESLAPLELFIHQAAVAIENARLIEQLNNAKNQISEYADQLELKVKQRTQQLMEAQKRLLKSERLAAIGEIAAMVGHDLRNPLTGIAGATYYLKMKSDPKMGKKAREMLELIEEDIEYSNKIISDLLEYSIELRLEMAETTPKTIVKEALSLVKFPINIQVLDSTRTEPKIKVDAEKMKKAFVNIIKNAIDAMPKGGKLTITSKESDGSLEITFSDTGVGMSKDTLEKLWAPLFTTKAKGMGLGLPICKRIIEAHGGNISVDSTVGKGTTLTVTIPVEPKLEGEEKVWVELPESLLSTTKT